MAERKDIALDHIITKVPVAYPHQTVGEVLRTVREGKWESSHHIFIINNKKERKYLGVLSTRVLLESSDEVKISEIFKKDYPSLGSHTHEDSVAILAIRHDLDTVPVIRTETSEFLGTVDAEELLDILHESHAEKLLQRAGVLRDSGETIVDIFRARVSKMVRLRLPWLLVGLFGGMATTLLISQFEPLLGQVVALAFFIPVIAYMNDAVGTQTVTLFVRGLALEKVLVKHYVLKELAVGLIIGTVLGLLIFLFSLLVFGSLAVAETVGLAMFIGITISTMVALSFTYAFYKLGKDPAVGVDPLVTIVQDTLSVLIYLLIASALVL
jgi:magnesium transporter